MSSNVQRLGEILSSRMLKTSNAAIPTTIELGIINSNLSLTTDSIPAEIPKEDYLKSEETDLKSGDRVLVAWCGNDPVVIAPVIDGSRIIITIIDDGNGNITVTGAANLTITDDSNGNITFSGYDVTLTDDETGNITIDGIEVRFVDAPGEKLTVTDDGNGNVTISGVKGG